MNRKTKTIFACLAVLLFLGGSFLHAVTANDTLVLDVQTNQQMSTYDFLILSPDIFVAELEPLVAHKESIGIRTKLVTLTEIYEETYWQGQDDAEKIKYFIKNSMEEWGIDYVLLVGGMNGQKGSWLFPVRYIHLGNDWESEIISDLYFADIYDNFGNFSSWDSNENGIFGEWTEGGSPLDVDIDLIPDIAIGRIPCRNALEVRWMVNKIIKYEENTHGEEWFNRFTVIAGDTYPEDSNPDWTGYEGEYYGDLAIENMTDFEAIRLYTSDETFSSRKDVINAFNQGSGFIYLVGHGSPMTWGNNKPYYHDFVRGLWYYDIYRMKNINKLPILVFSGCHNLQFDVGLRYLFNQTRRYHMEYVYESIGWIMTYWKFGGSIATLGCTALGHTKEDKTAFEGGINELEVAMFHSFGQGDCDYVGDMWKAGVTWHLETYTIPWGSTNQTTLNDGWVDMQVPSTYVLFGDPTLRIGGYPDTEN